MAILPPSAPDAQPPTYNEIATAMREGVGTEDWFAIPLLIRLRIVSRVSKICARGGVV